MRIESNPDHVKAEAFFERVLSTSLGSSDARLIVIAHLVDSAKPFIPTLDRFFRVQALFAKPSSAQQDVREYIHGALPNREYLLEKERFRRDPASYLITCLPKSSTSGHLIPLIISDIGGYFVPNARIEALKETSERLKSHGYRLMGVIEDTQNGHNRYRDALKKHRSVSEIPEFRIFSVAQSPLKQPENHLVGVAVTFSVEAILRQSNVVLQSRRAGVIGFGPIGASVAHAMRNRGIAVSVCETDPIRLAQAAAQGFKTYHYNHHFDDFVRELNLLVSATGNASKENGAPPLDAARVRLLKRGTYVASVTSSDDEMDLVGISNFYDRSPVPYNPDISRWVHRPEPSGDDQSPHSFYLMMEGNAVNFRHNGVIGPAIQLLQGEIAMCIRRIVEEDLSGKPSSHDVMTLSDDERRQVANMWLDQYITDAGMHD